MCGHVLVGIEAVLLNVTGFYKTLHMGHITYFMIAMVTCTVIATEAVCKV